MVTHPFHPLRGQRLAVLFERRLADGRLDVCEGGPAGTVGVSEDATDRAPAPALMALTGEVLAGLVELVAVISGSIERASGRCPEPVPGNRYKLMTEDLGALTDRQLRRRRQRLAGRIARVELTLPGWLVRQGRRWSSSGCRCRRGELHGPCLYLALSLGGRNRTLYVPAAAERAVSEHVEVTHANEAALEEIARINVELLRRRALG